jgi:hypothetical protein
MMNDVAEKMRAGEAPLAACRIGAQLPQALARGNEQCYAAPPRDVDLRHVVLPTSGLPKLRLRLSSDKTLLRDIIHLLAAMKGEALRVGGER